MLEAVEERGSSCAPARPPRRGCPAPQGRRWPSAAESDLRLPPQLLHRSQANARQHPGPRRGERDADGTPRGEAGASRDRMASAPSRSAPTTTTHASPSRSRGDRGPDQVTRYPASPRVDRNSTGWVRASLELALVEQRPACFTSLLSTSCALRREDLHGLVHLGGVGRVEQARAQRPVAQLLRPGQHQPGEDVASRACSRESAVRRPGCSAHPQDHDRDDRSTTAVARANITASRQRRATPAQSSARPQAVAGAAHRLDVVCARTAGRPCAAGS